MKNKQLHNIPEYSVSQISGAVKRLVEDSFSYVRIRGEISGLKFHSSGHIYFSLKDDGAVLASVCFRNIAGNLKIEPEEGLEVICTGRITTYEGQSKYQIIVNSIEHAGIGALMALLEKRKAQLAKEGLFDEERKKPLPKFPQRIAVVTSPTGAVVRDIIHRVQDRFPCHLMIFPVAVQGKGCEIEIANALNILNEMSPKPDLIIVARGGGSIEDLWGFNEEIVVRAVSNSDIPVISAVGHETDTTLIDYVADKRAPTPSAAAEMATPVKSELLLTINNLSHNLLAKIFYVIKAQNNILQSLAHGLRNPMRSWETQLQKLDDFSERFSKSLLRYVAVKENHLVNLLPRLRLSNQYDLQKQKIIRFDERLCNILNNLLATKKTQLANLTKLLSSLSYKNTLARGFAVVRNSDGKVIMSQLELAKADIVEIELKDGKNRLKVKK
jgi:exodeoxyribonuclease VII large subunit